MRERALLSTLRTSSLRHGHSRFLALAFVVSGTFWLFSARPSAQAPYTLVELPGPATDVSDGGTVAGRWIVAGGGRGFRWTQATGAQPMISDPAIMDRFPCSDPKINEAGVVVGQGSTFSCGVAPLRAARYVNGVLEMGNTMEGDNGQFATAVNAAGTAVGIFSGNGERPFIWPMGGSLGLLAGFTAPEAGGVANGINDANIVVGRCGGAVCPGSQAYWWNGQPSLLPPVPGVTTVATDAMAINNNGQIVGRYQLDGGQFGVFLSDVASVPATTVDLDAPQGFVYSLDINDAGDIVATISSPAGGSVPYVYRNGVWTDINTLRPSGSSVVLQTVVAINSQGWMVGGFGSGHLGYVLIPPPSNQAPTAFPDSVATFEDTPVSGTLVATDPNPGDVLTYAIETNGSIGTAVITDPAAGAFTYTPDTDRFGTDTFTFLANDGTDDSNTATITVTITPSNQPPVASDASISTLEDRSASSTLMAVDPEGARLAFSIVSAPSRGTVTITNVRNGRFTYVPNANANGADSFTFVASDGAANSNVATVTIAVTPVNDAPTVQNLALVTNPDQAVSATLLGSDVDGGALAFAVMRSPRRGTVQLLNAQTGAFLYTPIAGFQGTETFTFRASDGSAMSGNGTVTITVTP